MTEFVELTVKEEEPQAGEFPQTVPVGKQPAVIAKEPSEKDLSYGEYYQWLDRAAKARDDYLVGKLSEEEAVEIIQGM